jgi:hypothetical protein
MLKTAVLVSTVVLLSACVSNGAVKSDSATSSSATAIVENVALVGAVTVMEDIPYKEGSKIALNIRQECHITTQLSEFTQSYGKGQGIDVVRTPKLDVKGKGRNLQIEITEAVSQGNAFIGHRKYTAIEGTLYDSGNKVSGFTAARVSGGGFFGGYKGSCSVLGRTVETLGKDVAAWLKSPIDGAHLGDGV